MRKTWLFQATLVVVIVQLLFTSTVFAVPANRVQTSKVAKAWQQYEASKKELAQLQQKIASLDTSMGSSFQELEQLKDKQARIQKRADKIITRLYTSGQYKLTLQLFNAPTFQEFMVRLAFLRILLENDHRVLNQYKIATQKIEQHKTHINQQVATLKPLLKKAESKTKLLEREYHKLAEELKKQPPHKKTSEQIKLEKPPTKITDLSWLNKARVMIGTVKYKFGAMNYPYFDCSSWVQYVFSTYRGIQLPRTSANQATVGTAVSKSSLQPGDLVFFQGTYKAGISHVGIYLGNGNFISNKNEKLDLQIDSMDRSYTQRHYWGARRVNK